MNLITPASVLMTYMTYTQRPVGKLPDMQFENLYFVPGFVINLLHILTNFAGSISLSHVYITCTHMYMHMHVYIHTCVLCGDNI